MTTEESIKNQITDEHVEIASAPKGDDQMKDTIEAESHSDESVPDATSNKKPSPKKKSTQKYITASRRREVLAKHARGEEDPEFEVVVMKNGKTSLRQRRIKVSDIPEEVIDPPVQTPQPKSKDSKGWMIYADTQSVMNQQILSQLNDLSKRLDKEKGKRSRLKSKYKKLKKLIFEDDDVEEPPASEPHVEAPPVEVPQIEESVPTQRIIYRRPRANQTIDYAGLEWT